MTFDPIPNKALNPTPEPSDEAHGVLVAPGHLWTQILREHQPQIWAWGFGCRVIDVIQISGTAVTATAILLLLRLHRYGYTAKLLLLRCCCCCSAYSSEAYTLLKFLEASREQEHFEHLRP